MIGFITRLIVVLLIALVAIGVVFCVEKDLGRLLKIAEAQHQIDENFSYRIKALEDNQNVILCSFGSEGCDG